MDLCEANSYKSTARTLSSVAKGLADEANKATLTAAEKRSPEVPG